MEKVVTEQELKEKAVAPRVTKEQVDALMQRVKYCVVQQPGDTTSTFVHAFLDGKFLLATGFSGCVDAANFDADIGLRLATKDAEVKAQSALWGFEGYALYRALNPEPTTHIERMQAEYEEGRERLVKLQQFLEKGQPNYIDDEDWADLLAQYEPQKLYVDRLHVRLIKAVGKE